MPVDNSGYKYRNWVFTWSEDQTGSLVDDSKLVSFLKKETEDYLFQLEKGEKAGKRHYQGFFRTPIRMRQQTILNRFKESAFFVNEQTIHLTIDRMFGTWDENISYCSKEETREGKTLFCSENLRKYEGQDVNFIIQEEKQFPWQRQILGELLTSDKNNIATADDRKITWVTDSKGNSGKSKFVKYLCLNYNTIIKVPFGTASQIRSSVIAAGRRQVYFVDIPRTLGEDDSLKSIISALEDVKNGHIVSSMYGKYEVLLCDPPHVVVFSNERCPRNLMSDDRWQEFVMDPVDKSLMPGEQVDA